MNSAQVAKHVMINQLLRFGVLRELVDALATRPRLAPRHATPNDIWSDPYHPELPLRKFRTIAAALGGAEWLRGKTILEIGPGMSLGMGVVGIALGAHRCLLIDRERYVTRDERAAAAHRDLLCLVPTWVSAPDPGYADAIRVGADSVVPASPRLSYLIAPAEALPLEAASVDLSISHSTLEHVRDLDAVVRELARVTVPGGRAVHQVDLRDHLDPHQPLGMLRHSPRTWNLMASHRRGWTNRLRLPAYVEAFRRHGFAIERISISEQAACAAVAIERPHLAPQFAALADDALQPLGFYCVLTKGGV